MPIIDLHSLARASVLALKPYHSLRQELDIEGYILLDNNESCYSLGTPALNRYPDPMQRKLKARIADSKGVDASYVALGNGSDELIELLIRGYCEPGLDSILTFPPTFGMYGIAAAVNGVRNITVPLTETFQLPYAAGLAAAAVGTKLAFVCSPNNPTGNAFRHEDILAFLQQFEGLVIADETYIDFCPEKSLLPLLKQYSNLIVLQTFSKGSGLAALRQGVAYAHPDIIAIIDKIRTPYNINALSAAAVTSALSQQDAININISRILAGRAWLQKELAQLSVVQHIFPSDANYLLVRVSDAAAIHAHLLVHKILVSDRSRDIGCANCLRISVGTEEENKQLISTLATFGSI
jgi:histidinol-phosphate aminotransferase